MFELRNCNREGTLTSFTVLKTFDTLDEGLIYMEQNYIYDNVDGMLYHFTQYPDISAVTYPELSLQILKSYRYIELPIKIPSIPMIPLTEDDLNL